MAHVTTVGDQEARQGPANSRTGFVSIDMPAELRQKSEQAAKLECFLCESRFLIDLDEVWSTASDEAELLGRQFVGVSLDAALCPHCLHEVELAGAERMYWNLAQC